VLFLVFVFLGAGALTAGTAKAHLVNNGNNLIYDTDLKITWYDAPAALLLFGPGLVGLGLVKRRFFA
jgi:hypothetical protein